MRQNRRGRNRGIRKGTGGKSFDNGNGGEARARGNVHQLLDRYLHLARDAGSAGDRVTAENYLQHAEHYFRVINEMGLNHPRMDNRNVSVAAVNVHNGQATYQTHVSAEQMMQPGHGDGEFSNGSGQMNGDEANADGDSDGDHQTDMTDEPSEDQPPEIKDQVNAAEESGPHQRVNRGRPRKRPAREESL